MKSWNCWWHHWFSADIVTLCCMGFRHPLWHLCSACRTCPLGLSLDWITVHTSSLRCKVFTGCLWRLELSSRSPLSSLCTLFFINAARHISATWSLVKFSSDKSGRRQLRSYRTNAAVSCREDTSPVRKARLHLFRLRSSNLEPDSFPHQEHCLSL